MQEEGCKKRLKGEYNEGDPGKSRGKGGQGGSFKKTTKIGDRKDTRASIGKNESMGKKVV